MVDAWDAAQSAKKEEAAVHTAEAEEAAEVAAVEAAVETPTSVHKRNALSAPHYGPISARPPSRGHEVLASGLLTLRELVDACGDEAEP